MSGISDYFRTTLIGSLYAGQLFGIWLLGLGVLFLIRGRFSPSRTWNYLTPVFVAFERFLNRFMLVGRIALFAMLAGSAAAFSEKIPPPDAQTRLVGEKIFGLWWMIFLAETLQAAGFPPALSEEARVKARLGMGSVAVLLGVSQIFVRGPYVLIIGTLSLYYIALVFFQTWRLARSNYWSAREASPVEPRFTPAIRPHFLHVTDLHVTAAKPRVEPGVAGNRRLFACAGAIGRSGPAWLFVTGDVADHGREDEWKIAAEQLQSIKAVSDSVRIIIAPGNHDLGTAYNTSAAMFSQWVARVQKSVLPIADGTYLRRYLRFASQLEPDLNTADGGSIAALIARDAEGEAEVRELWKKFAATKDESDARTLLERGRVRYPEISEEHWVDTIGRSHWRAFEEVLVPQFWQLRWFSLFPLYVADPGSPELVIVMNSVAPDPTHGGGAWGKIGAEQIARFAGIVDTFLPERVYVLCHHAPVRWRGDRPPALLHPKESEEWSATSVIADDVASLAKAMAEIGKAHDAEMIFLCGHRHGGPRHETRVGTWEGGLIIEGASFADAGTAFGAGWVGEGRLALGVASLEEQDLRRA